MPADDSHFPVDNGGDGSTLEVALFATCVANAARPQAARAALKLLRAAGCRVAVPEQGCCGQPAFNAGYEQEARRMAEALLAALKHFNAIVAPSASCAGMLRHHYPELFRGDTDEARARELAGRVFELTEFLVRVLRIRLRDLGPPLRVALHTSCSAHREMGVAGDHLALLGQLDNVELVEPERKEECCGFGGTFAVKHPEISAVMVHDKAEALAATGATRMVTGDCGCLMNIDGHLRFQGTDLPAQHIASFVWERTRGTD